MLPERLQALLPNANSSAVWIRKAWEVLSPLPGGRKIYSRLLATAIPYTGSIRAEVVDLQPGFALVRLRDRRSVRNHVESIHAIALCNLVELTGNAALACSLADDARFIVTRLDMRYLKKARGTISGVCHCPPELSSERRELELKVELRNEQDELVATGTLTTLVGPLPPVELKRMREHSAPGAHGADARR
jgi:acyl-coenzyme A thioesterase PaaI-like protein